MDNITKGLIHLFELKFDSELKPVTVKKTYNGWAAWQDGQLVTRYYFSEEGANTAAEAYRDAVEAVHGKRP